MAHYITPTRSNEEVYHILRQKGNLIPYSVVMG